MTTYRGTHATGSCEELIRSRFVQLILYQSGLKKMLAANIKTRAKKWGIPITQYFFIFFEARTK